MTIPVKSALGPKFLFTIAAVLISAVLLFHPGRLRCEEEEEGESVPPEEMEAAVTTTPLHAGELPMALRATGTCIPNRKTPAELMVAEADFEKARAAFETAEAELKNAETAGLDVLQAELDTAAREAAIAGEQARLASAHEEELLADNLSSGQAARDAKAAMEIAVAKAASETRKAELFRTSGRKTEHDRLKAALAAAQADVKTAELDLESVRMVYPVAADVKEGAFLFQFWISPRDAGTLEAGADAVIYGISVPDGIPAKITSIGSGIDSETGLVRVSAEGDGGEKAFFLMGETVSADMVSGASEKGFIVPLSAVTYEDDNASVYVVDKDQMAHMVSVTVLARNAEEAVIEGENLADGATVITDGNYNLPDGAHVTQGAEK